LIGEEVAQLQNPCRAPTPAETPLSKGLRGVGRKYGGAI